MYMQLKNLSKLSKEIDENVATGKHFTNTFFKKISGVSLCDK